jgi:hypothetical protein
MATQRLVNTNFWKDTYVIDLDPTQKLLFLYFLTNPRTSMAGVYEISIREVAFDTGIDKDMVDKILMKFCRDEKMHYQKGWLILRNFVRHQRLNPSIQKGIERAVSELPKWLQEIVIEHSAITVQQQLLTDEEQTGNSLLQTGGNLIEAKLTKLNLMKPNETPAEAVGGFNKLNKAQKRNYALAVRADEALAIRAGESTERKGSLKSGYELAKERVEAIKHKSKN